MCGAALNTPLDVVQTVGVKGKTLMAVGMERPALCGVLFPLPPSLSLPPPPSSLSLALPPSPLPLPHSLSPPPLSLAQPRVVRLLTPN